MKIVHRKKLCRIFILGFNLRMRLVRRSLGQGSLDGQDIAIGRALIKRNLVSSIVNTNGPLLDLISCRYFQWINRYAKGMVNKCFFISTIPYHALSDVQNKRTQITRAQFRRADQLFGFLSLS